MTARPTASNFRGKKIGLTKGASAAKSMHALKPHQRIVEEEKKKSGNWKLELELELERQLELRKPRKTIPRSGRRERQDTV